MFKRNCYSKNEKKIDFKKDSRTDKSITLIEVVINSDPPPYESTKKKNHCILNIWKHKTGIKLNFDL